MRKIILLFSVMLMFGSGNTQALIFNSDGTIDGGTYSDVTIESTATVDMTAGTVETMLITQLGNLNFYGGTIQDEISLQDSGTLNLEGANFQGTQGIWMYDSSLFNLNSGSFTGTLDLSNFVNVNVNGGQIINGLLNSNFYAITDIYDGDSDWDNAWIGQFSTLNIYGGNVTWSNISISQSAMLNIYGGDIIFPNGFNLQDDAQINVYYSDVIYHEYDPFIIGYYLLDGSEFMLDQFSPSEIDQINFVPEPTTFLMLCLGAIALRKKQ